MRPNKQKWPTHRLEQKALQIKPIAEGVQGAFGKRDKFSEG